MLFDFLFAFGIFLGSQQQETQLVHRGFRNRLSFDAAATACRRNRSAAASFFFATRPSAAWIKRLRPQFAVGDLIHELLEQNVGLPGLPVLQQPRQFIEHMIATWIVGHLPQDTAKVFFGVRRSFELNLAQRGHVQCVGFEFAVVFACRKASQSASPSAYFRWRWRAIPRPCRLRVEIG